MKKSPGHNFLRNKDYPEKIGLILVNEVHFIILLFVLFCFLGKEMKFSREKSTMHLFL